MPHLSDHCHRSFVIKANFIDRDSLETSTELTLTEYNRLFWTVKSNDRLKGGVKSQIVQSRGLFLEAPGNYRAREAVLFSIPEGSFKTFENYTVTFSHVFS